MGYRERTRSFFPISHILSPISRLLALAAILVLGLLTYWSLRLTYADHLSRRNTRQDLEYAARLVPWNSDYQKRLGNFEAAVKLNPWDSPGWTRIALAAEMRGDFAKAESALLEAARVDKTFDPNWALANFYFRRNDPTRFWIWVRKAADMNYDDATVVFRLCWRMTGDADQILERAIPDRTPVLRQYLAFLVDQKRLDAARAVAERLAPRSEPADLTTLLGYCDQLLAMQDLPAALSVWNALSARKLIPYPALLPESITNARFSSWPLHHGFDWRLIPTEGVTAALDPPEGLRITFSGKQPEKCELLWQFVPVTAGKTYALAWRHRATAPVKGLHWRIYAPDVIARAEVREGALTFTAAENLIRIALTYERPPGATRIEGPAWLQTVNLNQ